MGSSSDKGASLSFPALEYFLLPSVLDMSGNKKAEFDMGAVREVAGEYGVVARVKRYEDILIELAPSPMSTLLFTLLTHLLTALQSRHKNPREYGSAEGGISTSRVRIS